MQDVPLQKVSRWCQVAAIVASLVLLTGCTGLAPSDTFGTVKPAEASQAANDADLHFAETMPGHHDQAVEMSKMLLHKSGVSLELADLAQDIQASHHAQYETMTTWPSSWAAAPTDPHTGNTDEDSPGHHGGQDGLMTEEQMEDLDLADTPSAQKLYLDGMIRHHQGALRIAVKEVRDGKHVDAVTLAQSIIDTHPDDIAAMTALRASL